MHRRGSFRGAGRARVTPRTARQCLGPRLRGDAEPILARISKTRRQTVLASATGNSPAMAALARKHARGEPVLLSLGDARLPPQLAHAVITTPRMKRLEALRSLFFMRDVRGVLVFVNEPRTVDIVCSQLEEMGLIAAPLKARPLRAPCAPLARPGAPRRPPRARCGTRNLSARR
jgi:superfamily II DNA/RNA helicase